MRHATSHHKQVVLLLYTSLENAKAQQHTFLIDANAYSLHVHKS